MEEGGKGINKGRRREKRSGVARHGGPATEGSTGRAVGARGREKWLEGGSGGRQAGRQGPRGKKEKSRQAGRAGQGRAYLFLHHSQPAII